MQYGIPSISELDLHRTGDDRQLQCSSPNVNQGEGFLKMRILSRGVIIAWFFQLGDVSLLHIIDKESQT